MKFWIPAPNNVFASRRAFKSRPGASAQASLALVTDSWWLVSLTKWFWVGYCQTSKGMSLIGRIFVASRGPLLQEERRSGTKGPNDIRPARYPVDDARRRWRISRSGLRWNLVSWRIISKKTVQILFKNVMITTKPVGFVETGSGRQRSETFGLFLVRFCPKWRRLNANFHFFAGILWPVKKWSISSERDWRMEWTNCHLSANR